MFGGTLSLTQSINQSTISLNSPIATNLCIFWRMRQQTRHNYFKMHIAHVCQPVADVLKQTKNHCVNTHIYCNHLMNSTTTLRPVYERHFLILLSRFPVQLHFRFMCYLCTFLPRCTECRCGLAMRILSVRPSVKRVDCDKTEEKSDQIFIPYERSLNLVF